MKEALAHAAVSDTAYLHLKQVFPLHRSILDFLKKDIKVAVIENNATGQLANLLKLHLSIHADERLLKYNGQPFSVEEISHFIKEVF